jgi:WD40 repeat protein
MLNASPVAIAMAIIVIICGFIIAQKFLAKKPPEDKQNSVPPQATNTSDSKGKAGGKGKSIAVKSSAAGGGGHAKFSPACAKLDSPLLLHDIGGHSVDVLAVSCSPDGQLVCSVSRDGTMRCTAVGDLGSAHQQHTASLALVGADMYSDLALSWTANSKRVVVNVGSKVVFFKIDLFSEKKSIAVAKTQDTPLSHIHKIQLLDVEKWMLVAVSGESSSGEHMVMLFDHAGTSVGSLGVDGALDRPMDGGGSSGKNRISKAKERAVLVQRRVLLEASPDNRYLAISGHVADASNPCAKLGWNDIGIYEVARLKSGEPTGLTLVFILAGHEGPVSAVAWNPSGQSAVTACKSGSISTDDSGGSSSSSSLIWRVWNTAVPKIDLPVSLYATSNTAPEGVDNANIVLNQPGTVAVFVSGCDIHYCSSGNGEVKNSIKGALGNSILTANSFFLQEPEKKELKWCFVTVVKSSKRIAIWKFKE